MLVPYHQLTVGHEPLAAVAERLAIQVAEALRPHLVKPNPERTPVEAYTSFCFSDVGGPVPDWVRTHRAEIAGLLNEEPEPSRLAERQVDETLSHSLAYMRDDFTVIDWDAALVVDASGYFDDVLYIIELANLQLEEFRLLDDRLDKLFIKAYEDLEKRSGLRNLIFGADGRLNAIRQIRMDITKMSEELTNITKFVGDWYLARVYLSCKHRFHLGHWESSVDQKLHEIDRLYTLAHQAINEKRTLLLEAAIVALFVFDVTMMLFKKKYGSGSDPRALRGYLNPRIENGESRIEATAILDSSLDSHFSILDSPQGRRLRRLNDYEADQTIEQDRIHVDSCSQRDSEIRRRRRIGSPALNLETGVQDGPRGLSPAGARKVHVPISTRRSRTAANASSTVIASMVPWPRSPFRTTRWCGLYGP